MKLLRAVLTLGITLAVAAPAMAQRQQTQKDSAKRTPVPVEARPPKGMCRIWIDGVPAAQQPAITDCVTAVKNRPAHARVIFGDDYADTSRRDTTKSITLPPGVKGFTGVKPAPITFPKRPPPDR